MNATELRSLPKVDALLEAERARTLVAEHGRGQVLDAIRGALEQARARIQAGESCPTASVLLESAAAQLTQEARPSLRPVINATGVVLHTNLGRAPLSRAAIEALSQVARGYSNLEFDLDAGERGSRYAHCGELLARLTGAEAGLVVNNNAAAVMLLLAAFGRGREVVVSRGQLVEIGGGFRVPDVMRESGAQLVEVGTTNRTYVRDYEAAVGPNTAAFMLLHRSNFQMTGFVHDAEPAELAALARQKQVLLIDDLGSGTLLDTALFGLAHEPKVQERVAAGAHLVCFSGDKLLGGPQAGFIVGEKRLIERLEKFPMLRALRVDKATLAGIEATLRHYLRGDAAREIPIWRSIAAQLPDLDARAQAWRQKLPSGRAEVIDAQSMVGGGSLPGLSLPTRALAVSVPEPQALARKLRLGEPALVARVEHDAVLLDPRTVQPDEDAQVISGLTRALGSGA